MTQLIRKKSRVFINTNWFLYLLISSFVLISSCSDDEPEPEAGLTGNETVYSLIESGESGISGTVTLEEREDGSTRITVQLTGTSSGGSHPNHIHNNSVVQSGGIAISLSNIDGETGMGVTEVTSTDDGAEITYSELIQFDGHVKVHLSDTDLSTIVAEGDIGVNKLTGDSEMYSLEGDGVEGSVKFEKRESGETLATVTVDGASTGSDHPSHIHENSVIEGGSIIISFNNVDGTTGIGKTHISEMDDETPVTYDEIINIDGHVVVHKSTDDFAKIATADIGQNVLTGMSEDYDLFEQDIDLVEGEITFYERKSGETLVVLELEGPHGTDDHPAHIHANTLVEGGGIVISFNEVVGGIGKTNVSQLDDGTTVTYSELKEFDGHVRVHASSSNMGTIVAAGDIGENALTGEATEYDIRETGGFGIEGTATISERRSGASLISLSIGGSGDHPSHIHENSDAEGGGILISLNNVVDGKSDTHVESDDAGNQVTYEQLLEYDGHIKIHNSESDFTPIARADIGQNALTGEALEYEIPEINDSGVSGVAVIEERENGTSLVTVELNGSTPGVEHPNHIHENSVVEGGSVVISLSDINGDSGRGETHVDALDDGTALSFEELINFDGHFKVHKNTSDFSVVAEGEAGGNVLTGESQVYQIDEVNGSGVSGTATFEERKNGFTLITLELTGTFGDSHPAHIHENDVSTGGSIVITFTNVDGATGISKNHIEKEDSEDEITYEELVEFNGHIRIHTSDSDFSAVAEGNIGSNSN